MQHKEGVLDRGPASVEGARDKALRTTAADVPLEVLAKAEDRYIFASKRVDIGDGNPIEGLQFIRMRPDRIRKFAEVARRERTGFVVCPTGWRPGR